MTNKTETISENHNTLHIPTREEFHQRFGGRVYECDFCTDYYPVPLGVNKGSRIAKQIESDRYKEDKLYINALKERKRRKEYEDETLEK